MAVYFKFSSWGAKANFDTVVLDSASPFLSVGELKQAIIKKKKIEKNNALLVTNAQTGEEYKDDGNLIQKNTSVIVKLIPATTPFGQTAPPQKIQSRMEPSLVKKSGADLDDDFGPAFWETDNANLMKEGALSTGSEEDKIQAIINSAADIPVSQRKGVGPSTGGQGNGPAKIPPPGYICFRCGQAGHFIYDCPTNGDPNYQYNRKPITMYGVPKSFLAASANGKNLEFKPNEHDFTKLIAVSGRVKEEKGPQETPKELTCPLCKNLLNNAVMIPCCGETACDDCIRSALMSEKYNFTCPLCSRSCSPDGLLPNKAVRRAVENYKAGGTELDNEKSTDQLDKSPTIRDSRSPTHPSTDATNHTDKATTDGVSNTADNKNISGNPDAASHDSKVASRDKDKERERERRRSRSRSPRDYRRRDYRDYPPYDYPPYGPPGMPPHMWYPPPMSKEEMRRMYEDYDRHRDYYRDRDYYHRSRRSRSRSPSRSPRRSRSRSPRHRSRSRSPRHRSRPDDKDHKRSRERDDRKDDDNKRRKEDDRDKKDSKKEDNKDEQKGEKAADEMAVDETKVEQVVPQNADTAMIDQPQMQPITEPTPATQPVQPEDQTKKPKEEDSKPKDKAEKRDSKDREREKERDKEKSKDDRKEKEKSKEKESERDKEKQREKEREKEKKEKDRKDKDKEREKDKKDKKDKRESSSSKRDSDKKESSSDKRDSKDKKRDSSDKKDKKDKKESDKKDSDKKESDKKESTKSDKDKDKEKDKDKKDSEKKDKKESDKDKDKEKKDSEKKDKKDSDKKDSEDRSRSKDDKKDKKDKKDKRHRSRSRSKERSRHSSSSGSSSSKRHRSDSSSSKHH